MRLRQLVIKNFGAFRDAAIGPLEPLTVLVGPNGSGKSTVFRVFETLREASLRGAEVAFAKYGLESSRYLGSEDPISFEFTFFEGYEYRISFAMEAGQPTVLQEELQHGGIGLFQYSRGSGTVLTNESQRDNSEAEPQYDSFSTSQGDELALGVLGRLASEYPSAAKVLAFFSGWFCFRPDIDLIRSQSASHRSRRLEENAGNLAAVLRGLSTKQGSSWADILELLQRYVPELREVQPQEEPPGQVSLQFRDAPFEKFFPAALASDGTLAVLAHAAFLYTDIGRTFVGLEEPETQIHHAVLHELTEQYRAFAMRTDQQVIIATPAPELLDALVPAELFVLSKHRGNATALRVADDANVVSLYEAGDRLGGLFRQNLLSGASP